MQHHERQYDAIRQDFVRELEHLSYAHQYSTKNTWSGFITGVRYELYNTTAASAKVNFNNISIFTFRDTADTLDLPAWSNYRMEYEITDIMGAADF
jgi:hypothetical protein